MAGAIRQLFGEIFFRDRNATKSIDGLNSRMNESIDLFSGLSNAAGVYGATRVLQGFSGFVGESLRVAAAFEQTQIAFNVMIGDASRASALLEGIEQFSLATPFTPEQLGNSARMMLNFGAAAENVLPYLRMLGDISGGDAVKLQALTLAFSQVRSQGRLQGQDLLQMINAGFNPLLVISQRTGKSMRQLRDEMSRGAVSFQQVQQAMEWATAQGGQFYGMMERQSLTWNGLISTMKGFIGSFMKKIGNIFMKYFKPILEGVVNFTRGMVEFFTKSERGAAILEIAIIALSVAMGVVAVLAIKSLIAAIIALNIVSLPFILIALAIIAVITAIILIVEDLVTGFQGGQSVIFNFFDSIKNWVVDLWTWVKKWFWKIIDFIVTKFTQLKNWFSAHGTEIVAVMFPFSAVVLYWEEIQNFLQSIPGRIMSVFSGLGYRIRQILSDMLPGWAIRLLERSGAMAPITAPDLPEPRAAGGFVGSGRSFVVGEDGPEILTMGGQAGYITSNNQLGRSFNIKTLVGNISIVVQNSMEAADEIESVIMRALNNLAENTLAAELGVNLT